MRLFVDSANANEIREALNRGIAGVTTNPSLLAQVGAAHIETLRGIVSEIAWSNVPLSVELVSTTHAAQVEEASWISSELQYEHLVYKVPISWDTLETMRWGTVNATAIMSYTQAIMAANAGARYVSIFWGRISDIGGDAADVVHAVRETFDRDNCLAEIIVGSVRQVRDVDEALRAGAHIVTVPPPILRQLCQHPKTDEVVAQFVRDAATGAIRRR